jgi:diguanylate cyclase (GGDEF)-like protein
MAAMDTRTSKPEFAEGTASEALRSLETAPPGHPYALAALGVIAAALVDHYTGVVLSAAFLYVAPVAFLGWLLGRAAGLQAALAATLAALLADWPAEELTTGLVVATLWNAAAAGALFAAIGWLAGEIRAHRAQLLHLANTDPLTGLHNRSSLLVALDNELARTERFGGDTGLLCIAIDGFRRVNEQHGTAAGDALLRGLAAELGEHMRRTDLVARIGGDEFAVMLTNTGPDSTEVVAAKLGETLNAWAATRGHAIGFSLGWSNTPLQGMSAEQLLARATAMVYDRKRAAGADNASPAIARPPVPPESAATA